MANREAEGMMTLYRSSAAVLAANREMPRDELQLMLEHWGDATAEPGGAGCRARPQLGLA
jgi:epsilon-lactone hydrolase